MRQLAVHVQPRGSELVRAVVAAARPAAADTNGGQHFAGRLSLGDPVRRPGHEPVCRALSELDRAHALGGAVLGGRRRRTGAGQRQSKQQRPHRGSGGQAGACGANAQG
jgi:hypothetical protein